MQKVLNINAKYIKKCQKVPNMQKKKIKNVKNKRSTKKSTTNLEKI